MANLIASAVRRPDLAIQSSRVAAVQQAQPILLIRSPIPSNSKFRTHGQSQLRGVIPSSIFSYPLLSTFFDQSSIVTQSSW